MKLIDNIYLVGTSHISKVSAVEVKKSIEEIKPYIVAVELDAGRAYSLKNKVKRPKNLILLKKLGLYGFLFFILGEFLQKRLGEIVNFEPGSEMLAAIECAEKHAMRLVYIDRDIQITLSRLSKYLKKKEILRMFYDMSTGWLRKDDLTTLDLTKVPPEEVINNVINYTKKRYPSFYKILISERDKHMALALFYLSKLNQDKKIVAVIGAGHLRGIASYLEQLQRKF